MGQSIFGLPIFFVFLLKKGVEIAPSVNLLDLFSVGCSLDYLDSWSRSSYDFMGLGFSMLRLGPISYFRSASMAFLLRSEIHEVVIFLPPQIYFCNRLTNKFQCIAEEVVEFFVYLKNVFIHNLCCINIFI